MTVSLGYKLSSEEQSPLDLVRLSPSTTGRWSIGRCSSSAAPLAADDRSLR